MTVWFGSLLVMERPDKIYMVWQKSSHGGAARLKARTRCGDEMRIKMNSNNTHASHGRIGRRDPNLWTYEQNENETKRHE